MSGEAAAPHAPHIVIHAKGKIIKYYSDGSLKVLRDSILDDCLEYHDTLNRSQFIRGEGDAGIDRYLWNRKYGKGITY